MTRRVKCAPGRSSVRPDTYTQPACRRQCLGSPRQRVDRRRIPGSVHRATRCLRLRSTHASARDWEWESQRQTRTEWVRARHRDICSLYARIRCCLQTTTARLRIAAPQAATSTLAPGGLDERPLGGEPSKCGVSRPRHGVARAPGPSERPPKRCCGVSYVDRLPGRTLRAKGCRGVAPRMAGSRPRCSACALGRGRPPQVCGRPGALFVGAPSVGAPFVSAPLFRAGPGRRRSRARGTVRPRAAGGAPRTIPCRPPGSRRRR